MSITKEQLVEAIKASYRRLEWGSNDIRIKVETDALIEQLARMVPVRPWEAPHPEIAAVYTDPPCAAYPRCGCPNTGECVR